MAYLEHQKDFSEKFLTKLNNMKRDVKELYEIRDKDILKQEKAVRLHSSTLDATSAFACFEAIAKNQITMGQTVLDYEKFFKSYLTNKSEVLSCNSGSSANLIAISTLVQKGLLKRGDKVIVPALAWSTTIFPLVQYGLIPIFCDCNSIDFNLSIDNLKLLIEENETKALMLIHTYGCPNNMDEITAICKLNKIILIEDTCESMGAEWDNLKVGTFGEVSSFSTYYSHHICTLEGGFACFKEKELFDIAGSIRSHGWVRHYKKNHQIFEEYSYLDPGFLFDYVGYNLRLSEPQAAIGIEQIKLLDSFILSRCNIAKKYIDFFKNEEESFLFQKPLEKAKSSWFGFPLILQGKLKDQRAALRKFLLDRNIETRPFLAGDFTLQPVVKKFKYIEDSNLEVSRTIAKSGLAIPCHQSLTKEDVNYVLNSIKDFISMN